MSRFDDIYGEEWVDSLPSRLRAALHDGRTIFVGDRKFRVCPDCRKVVRLNKFVLGSTHSCERPQ